MFQFLRDRFTAAGLRARYERLVQERLLELVEARGENQPVSEDPGNWQLLGGSRPGPGTAARTHLRDRARKVVRDNPHGCNILRLLEAYVTGPGLQLTHRYRADANRRSPRGLRIADRLWQDFLDANVRHYSFREHARRTWRDGECFLRRFNQPQWPPQIRFVDPELIAATADEPESQGILTHIDDVEDPIVYLKGSPQDPTFVERIPAEEMLHTRTRTDANEKRGVSIFAPLLNALECYEKWMETELLARKLQSSIVLWRKVQGSPQMADMLADRSAGASGPAGLSGEGRRERLTPGTILTTNHGTEIQFLQPNTNFGDAVPLGRMLLLGIAAGAGVPEFMLTADASNGNFASTMVAEGPAVKFFQSEQDFFAGEFQRLWRWIMQEAVVLGLLPESFFQQIEARWTFPQLVNRDRSRERLADVRLIESGVLSRAEVARRDGVDPAVMKAEREKEDQSETDPAQVPGGGNELPLE